MKNSNHGPTLQEALAIADHYGHGWLAGREALLKEQQTLLRERDSLADSLSRANDTTEGALRRMEHAEARLRAVEAQQAALRAELQRIVQTFADWREDDEGDAIQVICDAESALEAILKGASH